MARINWTAISERYYETGVDQGVLYVAPNTGGVPWSGLLSVNEAPTGGEVVPYYIDGFKFLQMSVAEEFEATIEAVSAPTSFAACDGSASLSNGLFATQQRRIPFDFTYRTLIGSDDKGLNEGYKIHLVYSAMVSPAPRGYGSIKNSADPLKLSWKVSTKPPKADGIRPTSHFVVDSTQTPPDLLLAIENILYGTPSTEARMPTVLELISIFQSGDGRDFVVTDNGDGSYEAYGWPVQIATPVTFTINHPDVVDNGDGSFTIDH